jgi:Sulfotransferase family
MSRLNFRYVFLVTYARSGSTLLQSLINAAPGVQMRGENNNCLLHLFRSWDAVQDTALRGRFGQQSSPDEPWFGAGAVKPVWYLNSMLDRFVNTVLCPDPEVKVTGFKEIRYIPFYMKNEEFDQYMDFMLENFPDARIVFNSRDAEAVSKSGWHVKEDPVKLMETVRQSDARFAAYAAKSDKVLHLRYDEYVKDHSHIRRMYEFLDLPFDADRIEAVFAKPLTHAKQG